MNELDDQSHEDHELERAIDLALRELPLRRAPSTLESRVFAELARRAALPWWQQSFAHWPQLARAAFFAVCASLGGLMCLGGPSMLAGFSSARILRPLLLCIGAAAETVASLLHAIPPVWLYGSLAVAALMYALLFALGAAAYRTLYLDA